MICDDNHFFRLVVVIAQHRIPITSFLVEVSGKTLLRCRKTDFHHALQVVNAFKVKIIDRHVVHTILQALGSLVVIYAIDC